MGQRLLRRTGLVALAAAAALVVGAMPASADTAEAPSAYGIQAHVSVANTELVGIKPTPQVVSTGGPVQKSVIDLQGLNLPPDFIQAHTLHAKAILNNNSGQQNAQANLQDVSLPGLAKYLGGTTPTIKVIHASCHTAGDKIKAKTTIAGLDFGPLLKGHVGDNVAPNTTLRLALGDVNVATVILNEQHTDKKTGRLTVNAIHIKLLGGPLKDVAASDIILSSATCGPAVLPAPMASGAGLWIGLGLLVVVAVPTGIVVIRKRRTNAQAAA